MKKTLIALMTLGSIAVAADATSTLTKIADMDTLIGSMTASGATSTTGYNQTVYTLSDGGYYGSTDTSVVNALKGSSGIVVFAAWVKVPDTSGYETLVGWGASGTGFKFGVKEDDLFYVTKNKKEVVWDRSIAKDEWTLIALQYDVSNNHARISFGTSDNTYTDYTDGDIITMNAVTNEKFSIGSPDGDKLAANTQAGNENFDGMISGFKVFTANSFVNNSVIATAVGSAPKSIPEPTTATLSLLALAGLAARRRRK